MRSAGDGELQRGQAGARLLRDYCLKRFRRRADEERLVDVPEGCDQSPIDSDDGDRAFMSSLDDPGSDLFS